MLQNFGAPEQAQALTDVAELTLFVWREFSESPTPPAVQGGSVGRVIERLRTALQA